MSQWKTIACTLNELRLDLTLACGQSFRWAQHSKTGEWRSVLAGRVFSLKQSDSHIHYQVLATNHSTELSEKDEAILRDYFHLDIDLNKLYQQWSEADSHFEKVAKDFTGIRMLRQDPVENVFSFICSSNNHISRISGMVERMCAKYGSKIGEVDGQEFFSFPSVESLAQKQVESELRELGFGYRAKYIQKSAEIILAEGGESWLHGLRNKPYEEAKQELLKLNGVGAKVADCVLLMSLDKTGAIPVDTHVWQIASRDYMPGLKACKSVTDRVYNEIGVFFRELWGEYAGWAHSVLFSADLKKFQSLKEKGSIQKPPASKRKAILKTCQKSAEEKKTSQKQPASKRKVQEKKVNMKKKKT